MTPERWQEVDRVFQEALTREEPERTAFLAEIGARDPSLRSEVDALLAYDRSAEAFLKTPAMAVAVHSLAPASDTIAAGHVIGGFTILSRLGAGGMGEVYRARDPRLERDVAIKVLSPLFTANPDRLSRLEREARMLASLNHPHIGAIYGLENMEETPALVLELIEGDTLAERIADGPIAASEALALAGQVAAALEAAHDKGIVHRDLKPANIKITPDGLVKVLDFGLAKAAAGSEAGPDLAKSPAVSALGGTREGTLLGTVAYMSPEQARGKVVDRRTDIWAFGCVLYEMLSGLPAFSGDTLADTLAGVIGREPDWAALPAGTSSDLRRLLKRCLEKNPSRRLRDAADVRIEIDDLLHERSADGPAVQAAAPKAMFAGPVWLQTISIGVITAVVAGLAAWTLKPGSAPNPSPIARLSVSLPPGDTIGLVLPSVALSPDGRLLAYTARRALIARQLFVRPIDGLDVRLLTGTEGAVAPFFSPDGRWIGFFAGGKLKKVLATGGGLQTLCNAAAGFGGTWATDGSIYFAPFGMSGIWQVAASGGSPREVTRLDRTQSEVSHRWPQVSADGKVVLFTVWTGPGWDEKHLEAQILGTGERRVLVRGASTGRYVSSGHLLYARNEELFVVPFDLTQSRVTGPPVTLVDRASEQAGAGEGAQFTVSDGGTLAYIPAGSRASDRRMVWVTAGGHVEPLNSPPGVYTDPAISPDGRFVAVSIEGPTQTIWVYDLARSTLTTLPSVGSSQAPTWTSDGLRLVYRGTRAGYRNVFWRVADGSADEERLTAGELLQTPSTVSHEGTMVFVQASPDTGKDIWMMQLEAGRVPQPVLTTRFNEGSPKLSPNGRWLAYTSDESGRNEIYVRPFPTPGGKFAISTEGGTEPRWSRDGRELFYRNGSKMMAVTMAIGSTPAVGTARLLFEGQYQVSDTGESGYDVSSDGRFLMIESTVPQQPVTHITVVLNWFDELKRTVAGERP